MSKPTNSVEATFVEVRKAYRLLHDYQRMVMDGVDYVGKQLGFTYAGGYSKFSATAPGQGRGQLKCWSWDWLNMIQYEFHFSRQADDGGLCRMSLLLISDTGFFCSRSEDAKKTDIDTFLPLEESATKLGLLISSRGWPDPKFMRTKEGMQAFIERDGEMPPEHAAAGVIGGCWSLARLTSEEEASRLVDEIAIRARTIGIPMQRIGKSFS
jgi:hypothetical protein